MMNKFSEAYSKFASYASNAIGKMKQVGTSVGKHVTNFASMITPEAMGTPNLTGLSKTLAIISDEAYKTNRRNNINGYTLDQQLSNYNTVIYYNSESKSVIIGFRGTASLEDIKTDVSIGKGTIDNEQFNKAVEIYNQVKSKYPDFKIYATGHSKGGSLALHLNKLFNVPVEVFNAGVGLNFTQGNPNSSNAIMHVIKGDAISALAGLSKLGIVKTYNSIFNNASPLEAHKMANFLQ